MRPATVATALGLVVSSPALTRVASAASVPEELCLVGELDLAVRRQGRGLEPERYPTRWCVTSSPEDDRVHFVVEGRSNADMEGSFAVSYLGPDRVRIVNREAPPDLDFRGTLSADEASATRRLDPLRLVAELERHPEWAVQADEDAPVQVRWPGAPFLASVSREDGRLRRVETRADLPLRGRVPVVWEWSWTGEQPSVRVLVDGELLFEGTGKRRTLDPEEAEALWRPSGGEGPRELPGKRWPSVVSMRVVTQKPGVHFVEGVRTGFRHLVVETAGGLVVVDAPAGWVEVHQLPPLDLVPGLGISGLSERFVDYLGAQWPGVPIRAVVLTHAHDDHAGGARAFAAAGAQVYAPRAAAAFLQEALNSDEMPTDRLSSAGGSVVVQPVGERRVLDDPVRPVELLPIEDSPHVSTSLGVLVPGADLFFQSDLHVPGTDSVEPRADRVAAECWFAAWVSQRLPPSTVVHNSHSAVALPVSHLGSYLEAASCQGR